MSEKALHDRHGRPYVDLGYTLAYLTPCCREHATIDEHGVLYCRGCLREAPWWCAAGPLPVDLPDHDADHYLGKNTQDH